MEGLGLDEPLCSPQHFIGLTEAHLSPSGTYTVSPLHVVQPEGLVDLFLFQGGDCLERPPLDKMVGFAWSPWRGAQDEARTRGEGLPGRRAWQAVPQ